MASVRRLWSGGPRRPDGRLRAPRLDTRSSWVVACSVLILAVGLVAAGRTRSVPGQTRPSSAGCRVQIVSVKLSKATIHTTHRPREAVLWVAVDVRGDPPKGATATVEVGTYSADPAENDVVYVPAERTLGLKPGRTQVEFSIRTGPKTSTGSVVVAGTLERRKQRGVRVVSMQHSYTEWRVGLTTRVP